MIGTTERRQSRRLFVDDDLEEELGEMNDKLSMLGIERMGIARSSSSREKLVSAASQQNTTPPPSDTSGLGENASSPSDDHSHTHHPPHSHAHVAHEPAIKTKKESLSIRHEDETRIITSLQNAVKKQTTGSIYSVVVDISKTGALDIGVKDLADNVLAVSLLKRKNNKLGAGELAGIRLGDVIFGVNFIPLREGSATLISLIKDSAERKKKILHVQGWRCHQLCSDSIPGYVFPRMDEMIVHSYGLYRSKVFSEWERWNFVEIMLGHMVENLWMRSQNIQDDLDPMQQLKNPSQAIRHKQMQVLDLERNILQAKGLRTALNVRVVYTKNRDDAQVYVLRVEDVESGLHWTVNRRYQDFQSLYEELLDMSSFVRDVDFPRRRITLRLSAKVIESRIIALEQFVRKALHALTLYATMDSSASQALRHLQTFLGVDKHMDCVHPPTLDDQRAMELLAYHFLNDYNSPACMQCVRFTTSVELESMVEPGEDGYKGLLTFLHDALAEVEQFVQQQHEQQMLQALSLRKPEWTDDQRSKLVRQCIRRQVESALFLPLRRSVFRILQTHLNAKIRRLHSAVSILQQAKPSVFMIDSNIQRARSLPLAITTFRKALLACIPSDQGQFLVEAAQTISELHGECRELHDMLQRAAASPLPRGSDPEAPPSADSNGRNVSLDDASQLEPRVLERVSSLGNDSAQQKSMLPSKTSLDSAQSDSSSPVSQLSTMSKRRNKRRSSLKERIQLFKENEEIRCEPLSDGDEDDCSVTSRVSFSSSSRHTDVFNRDQLLSNMSTSQRAMVNLLDFEEFLNAHSNGGEIVGGQMALRSPDNSSKTASVFAFTNKSDKTTNTQDSGKLTTSATSDTTATTSDDRSSQNKRRTQTIIRTKGDVDPLLRPPVDENFKLFADVFDQHKDQFDKGEDQQDPNALEDAMIKNAISADDFLPLFTYVLVHSGVPNLFLVKEIMVNVIANEDAYGECGYYLATLEAAIEHILDLASQYEGIAGSDGFYDDGHDIFDDEDD